MNLPLIAIVYNWRNEKNKSGLYSIHIRITIDRISRYLKIPVPKKVAEEQWSGKEDAWIKPAHPFAFEINSKIREKKNIVNELIKRSYNYNKSLSFENIFSHLQKKGDRNSFHSFFDNYNLRPPDELKENTRKTYKTTATHLKAYKKTLFFNDIDAVMVQGFHKFMQSDLNLSGGACRKYMEVFKKVIKQARKENYLDPSQMEFLFDDVKIKVGKPKRVSLEPDEIKRWKNHKFGADQKFLERDRDLFLFQIYTGYYYKDLAIFMKDQLKEDEEYGLMIIGARDKNGNQTIIPLFKFPYASEIINKYKSPSESVTVFNSAYFIEEPVYNRHLKEIAMLAEIKKSVSNKTARHTNAQLWVRYGAERQTLSKMLGHRKEETTKHYYDINIPEIVEGTKRVDFKRLGI